MERFFFLEPTHLKYFLPFGVSLCGLLWWALGARIEAGRAHFVRWVFYASLLLVLTLWIPLIQNLAVDKFLDHAEAHVASVSWLSWQGKAVYHALDSAERYSLFYGPFLYLAYGAVLTLLGPSFFSAKLGGVLAFVAAMAAVWRAFRRGADSRSAWIWMALCAAACSIFYGSHFHMRSDPMVLLAVSVGMLSSLSVAPARAAIGLGICCGLAVNMKVHGFLYFTPFFILVLRRFGIRTAALGALITGSVALLPFLLPNISLQNYLRLLGSARGQFDGWSRFADLWLAFVALAAPAWVHWLYARTRGLELLALLASGTVTSYIATRGGAGPWHFMPFLPTIFLLSAPMLERAGISWNRSPGAPAISGFALSFLGGYAIAIAMLLAPKSLHTVMSLRSYREEALVQDLEKVLIENPNKGIALGYGAPEFYHRSFFRPYLVWKGHPYFLDAVALMDYGYMGIPLPAATLERLEGCEVQLWLIPKDEAPFTLDNWYGFVPLFSDELRRRFKDSHRKVSSSNYYDIYECGAGDGAGAKP